MQKKEREWEIWQNLHFAKMNPTKIWKRMRKNGRKKNEEEKINNYHFSRFDKFEHSLSTWIINNLTKSKVFQVNPLIPILQR